MTARTESFSRALMLLPLLGWGVGTPAVTTAAPHARVTGVSYSPGNPFLTVFVAIPRSVDDAARSGLVDFGILITLTYVDGNGQVDVVDNSHFGHSIKLDTRLLCMGGTAQCPGIANGDDLVMTGVGGVPPVVPPGGNPSYAPTADILDPKCIVSKYKASGKKCSAEVSCIAKGASKGAPPDPTCLADASAKFSSAFSQAEAKGGCVTTADPSTIGSKVDAYVADLRQEIWT